MIVDVHRHYMPKELFESYGPLNKPACGTMTLSWNSRSTTSSIKSMFN